MAFGKAFGPTGCAGRHDLVMPCVLAGFFGFSHWHAELGIRVASAKRTGCAARTRLSHGDALGCGAGLFAAKAVRPIGFCRL